MKKTGALLGVVLAAATGWTQSAIPGGSGSGPLIGCMTGPDADGHLVLRSMQHRTGVEVVGPEGLAKTSGKKVKLTGAWETSDGTRRFVAKQFAVMEEKCSPPAETQPVKKKKE